MSMRVLVALSVASVFVLGLPGLASAQVAPAPVTPTYELSGGYQLLRLSDQTFPYGLNIDAARHFGSLGLVGEAGWVRDSEDFNGSSASLNLWNVAAGGRWTRFHAGRVWPFVQVLAGATIAHGTVSVTGLDDSDTETSFMVQPGVGVNVVAGDGWGIVGQVDYRRTFFDVPDEADDEVNNQVRVFIGLRMILD